MSIHELARELNQSTWRTWRLIWALKPVMKSLCSSNVGEPFAFKPEAVDLLCRAKALRESGIAIKQLETFMSEKVFNLDSSKVADPSLN